MIVNKSRRGFLKTLAGLAVSAALPPILAQQTPTPQFSLDILKEARIPGVIYVTNYSEFVRYNSLDGSSDWTQAFQMAINEAVAMKHYLPPDQEAIVYVPAGRYQLGPGKILTDRPLTLGAGAILEGTGPSIDQLFYKHMINSSLALAYPTSMNYL